MDYLTLCLAAVIVVLALMFFGACGQLSNVERRLTKSIDDHADEIRKRMEVEHDLFKRGVDHADAIILLDGVRAELADAEDETIEARLEAATLRDEIAARPAPTLARYERRRVLVNAVDGTRAWRGVLREELDDAIILDPCEVLERNGRAEVNVEAVPGEVVIPGGRIDFVQVIRDDA